MTPTATNRQIPIIVPILPRIDRPVRPSADSRTARAARSTSSITRLRSAATQQRGDLRVRTDAHEAAAELLTLADPDQPGVILGRRIAGWGSSYSRIVTFTSLGVPSE